MLVCFALRGGGRGVDGLLGITDLVDSHGMFMALLSCHCFYVDVT